MKVFKSFFLCGLVVSVIGCSQFKSSKRIELRPFAENMIAIAGDIEYGLGQKQVVYLRGYSRIPEFDDLHKWMKKLRGVIRGSIAYSIEVVTLAESTMTGPERAKTLANYLGALLRPVLQKPKPPLNLTQEQLDKYLENVRWQETLLDALKAAQPIIDEIAYASGEILENTKESLDITFDAIQNKIEIEDKDIIEANKELRKTQIETLRSLRLLKDYMLGNKQAMDTLIEREWALTTIIKPGQTINSKNVTAIEERLLYKLSALRDTRDQLQPDLELYWKKQKELDEIMDAYNQALRKARVAMIAWSRAHQRLASGITDPARIDLFGIARSAATSAF